MLMTTSYIKILKQSLYREWVLAGFKVFSLRMLQFFEQIANLYKK